MGCGPPVNNLEAEFCIVGSDVKALYPSIQSEPTGKIIRKKIETANIEFEGFDIEKGLAYIAMNKKLTTDIEEIENLLPTRRSNSSKDLKMSAVPANWDPSTRFEFKNKLISLQDKKRIIARVVEIATRTLFENHMYKFGGKVYKQENGGSIGDRWTCSAAEIVVQDWADKYRNILVNSGLTVHLLAGYVDDGRQGTSTLPMGMEYNKQENVFKYSIAAEQEDKKKQAGGESTNQRMARRCQVAMNSINPDLEFTVECQEDFENEKLPTLDFSIWQEQDHTINHTYFQKDMKTPYLVMARSSMSMQQKIQIESNELARRLGNVDKNRNNQQEINKIIEQFTQEIKNSEYTHNTAREIITSGIRCWKTRIARKEMKGQEMYRPAHKTLKARAHKKLMLRETWYKAKNEEQEQAHFSKSRSVRPPRGSSSPGNPPETRKNTNKCTQQQEKSTVKSVMLVPHTPGSELTKLLRENEENLLRLTSTEIKIV